MARSERWIVGSKYWVLETAPRERAASYTTPVASVAAIMPSPRTPPPSLLPHYTLNGAIPMETFYVNEEYQDDSHYHYERDEIVGLLDLHNRLGRLAFRSKSKDWLADAIKSDLPTGARAVVFGSVEPWVEVLLLAAGAANVTTVEYNRLTYDHPQLFTTLAANFQPDGQFDFAVAHGAFDHDGLGRYGERLHPDGDLLAMRTAWRALRPGGKLLLSLPTGPDLLVWNLHRRYGPIRLPRMLAGWKEVRRVGWKGGSREEANAARDHRQRFEPIFVLERNSTSDVPMPPAEPPIVEVVEGGGGGGGGGSHDEL